MDRPRSRARWPALILGVVLLGAVVLVLREPALRSRIVQVAPSPPSVGTGTDATERADDAGETAGGPVASATAPSAASAPAATPALPPGDSGAAPAGPFVVPVQGVAAAALRDTFGEARGSERRHEALDILAPAGTPVLAIADGRVVKLFDSRQGGLTLYQFDPSERFAYYYAHLQGYAPGIGEGRTLRRGEVLGYVGSTGNADPSAPHLHFAVFALGPDRQWWEGTPLNPYPLLRGATAVAAAPGPGAG